jgi:serine-type D-Ala-D-Ala carboxypeptidase/endopeptidase (penicillin-binding protein 4)
MKRKKMFSLTILSFGLVLLVGCGFDAIQEEKSSQLESPIPEAPVNSPIPLVSPTKPDANTNKIIQGYIKGLTDKGFALKKQGVWLQTNQKKLLANTQGNTPLPAASLTKVATSLVALKELGPDYQFLTKINYIGVIKNGILKGNLVIEGGQDPFFVWEDAIALGNFLNQQGLKKVQGNLIIVGKFYMNYESDPQKSGILLKEALNFENWSEEVQKQYQTLPPGLPKPQVEIEGSIQVQGEPSEVKPFVNHYSFPLAELVKKMNLYSNNLMADMLADAVGGAERVADKAAAIVGISSEEIKLFNGSGLSEQNVISPRVACGLFMAIQETLKPYKMNISDVFYISGIDPGILTERKNLPPLLILKSGTLDNVSALGGAIPTKNKGIVWFTIMNGGDNNLPEFRKQQEMVLQTLLNEWGTVETLPPELTPNPQRKTKMPRNELAKKS